MPLTERERARLPASAFAYVDSQGRRRLPIHDASHVRNALARFEQVAFEDDASRERARRRLLHAAARYGVVPVGFVSGQVRRAEARARGPRTRGWPRGTVTFLLTDIEGSTRLLRRLGDRYARLLRDVRAIHRGRVKAAGGHEIDARADEYFAAFAAPGPAVEAALGIAAALRERPWPEGVTVRVRAGIHTGRTTLSEAGYVGIAVHTAARVCSSGRGGQILVTATTRDALGEASRLVVLRSAGRRTLAGIAGPVGLYRAIARRSDRGVPWSAGEVRRGGTAADERGRARDQAEGARIRPAEAHRRGAGRDHRPARVR